MPADLIVEGDPYLYKCPNCGYTMSSPIDLISSVCFTCSLPMPPIHHTRPVASSNLFDSSALPKAEPAPAAGPKAKSKLKWGSSVSHAKYRYECGVCQRAWISSSTQSQCGGCRCVYLPVKALGDGSKSVVRTKDLIVEQLHLTI